MVVVNMSTNGYSECLLKWDPKQLEIKTRSVEKTLEPLVNTTLVLVNTKGTPSKKSGRSKQAHILVAAVEKATQHFIEKGQEIAMESPEKRADLLAAVDEVRKTGEPMSRASREFAEDPCSSVKRGAMVKAARNLLSAVTRLLILADMVDVDRLLRSLSSVQEELDNLRNCNHADLAATFRRFGHKTATLISEAARRQAELKDARMRDDLAAARAVLKKNSMMLLTASKVLVRHPDLGAARENRDIILRQVCEAVGTIGKVAQGQTPVTSSATPGKLAIALDDLDETILMRPMDYSEEKTRPFLEASLENIIREAAQMADSYCTRDERRERIVAECNAVRQALQDLLSEYMANTGRAEPSHSLDKAVSHMTRKTDELRRQLRKAVIDHVSDCFMDTCVPLVVLIEAALSDDPTLLEPCAMVFSEHAYKLVEVARLACNMSSNEDGVKMVQHAASHIELLCPQVINAARILAARRESKAAQENMEEYKKAWESQVKVLTEAVDDISTIDDFLAVSESHILEDVKKCVEALQSVAADELDRAAGSIRGRVGRVCTVVLAELAHIEPDLYADRVKQSVSELKDRALPNFSAHVGNVLQTLIERREVTELDEAELIEAARLVYDGIREIRRRVVRDDLDSEPPSESDEQELDEFPGVSGVTNARDAFRLMPEEEKEKIAVAVETFRSEKNKFDLYVGKWDDTGNDIIVLAKSMCMVMMQMTDFTRGKGPLKTTMDVINAAKNISDLGTRLDKLARQLADQCSESDTKKDLLAYLQKIVLYCHQLNITSKVKADVQNISGNLIVSGLDSATSLIQAAKNLMNAVVLTVKASYVASTKYPRQAGASGVSPIVVWKMRAPEKKPLVRRERPEEAKAKVRRASHSKAVAPIKALSEFQSPAQ